MIMEEKNRCIDSKEALWEEIRLHEGRTFYTAKGLEFSYRIKGGELFIDRKENSKSITVSTVYMAYDKAVELMDTVGYVSGPKKLGTFGASYLYPMFLEFGIISKK